MIQSYSLPLGNEFKYQQIINLIAGNIADGTYKESTRLPTIHELSEKFALSKITVTRAYMNLKKSGFITSEGKSFYVESKTVRPLKVLLVFNKLCSYKKMVYDGIMQTLGALAKVDLKIHHYDTKILKFILDESLGKYDYYIVMPHFTYNDDANNYMEVLKRIPPHQLLLLDKNIPENGRKYASVWQDFKEDVYTSLSSVKDLLEKYNRIVVVFPSHTNHPKEIIEGVKKFCEETKMEMQVLENALDRPLVKNSAYVVIEENELADIIKESRTAKLSLGKDVGIISFNETVLKEVLDITVFSTDFTEMGNRAAAMLLTGEYDCIKNN